MTETTVPAVAVRDEYAPRFGRQRLTLWGGGFASEFTGWATELPNHAGFMVELDWGRGKARVACAAPRTSENYLTVDAALSQAVAELVAAWRLPA